MRIGGNSTSILVVDDSATVRTLVRTILNQIGYALVDEASNGQAALAAIQSQGYTLIISDWNMAPMDGLALLAQVRRLQKPRLNRFIFMTTDRSWGAQATARLDGADAFIVKPFKADVLRTKISEVLRRAAPRP